LNQGFLKAAMARIQPRIFACGRAAGSNKWKTAIVLLAVGAAVPLCAQQSRIYREGASWVEETTGTLPTGREIRVNTDMGSVQVHGNSPNVTYVIRKRSFVPTEEAARRQFEQLRILVAKASIEGRLLGRNLNRFNAEFVVQVPRELELVRVETRMGALNLNSLTATILGSTGGGNVKLDDLAGPVKISSGGGSVEGGNLGADFTLTSGGGDVHINNIAGQARVTVGGGKVYIGTVKGSTITTGAGGIEVRKCDGDLRVTTDGGNLYFGDVSGSVRADTGGGSVRLASANGRVQVSTGGGSVELDNLGQGAQVETGAGPITVAFANNHGSFTDSSLHTAAGDVSVCLPANMPVTVHASSDMTSGKGILSDFPGLRITTTGGDYGPRAMSAEGALNGGGPILRIRTTIGQINFKRCH
jgi:Putative adhesin